MSVPNPETVGQQNGAVWGNQKPGATPFLGTESAQGLRCRAEVSAAVSVEVSTRSTAGKCVLGRKVSILRCRGDGCHVNARRVGRNRTASNADCTPGRWSFSLLLSRHGVSYSAAEETSHCRLLFNGKRTRL